MTYLRSLLILILLSLHFGSYSQVNNNSAITYKSVKGIALLTDDTATDKMGVYRQGKSLYGLSLSLDSNMHFRQRIYNCVGGEALDSGIWIVYKTGRIGLKSKSASQTFDVIKFSHYSICIPPKERAKFINDFLRLQAKYKGIKPVDTGDLVLTLDDIVAYSLMNRYYLCDLRN